MLYIIKYGFFLINSEDIIVFFKVSQVGLFEVRVDRVKGIKEINWRIMCFGIEKVIKSFGILEVQIVILLVVLLENDQIRLGLLRRMDGYI